MWPGFETSDKHDYEYLGDIKDDEFLNSWLITSFYERLLCLYLVIGIYCDEERMDVKWQ